MKAFLRAGDTVANKRKFPAITEDKVTGSHETEIKINSTYLIFSILTGMALSKLDSPFIGIADFTDSILTGISVLCN